MPGGRVDLAVSMSSPFEFGQHIGHVARLSKTARLARYGRRARLVIHRTDPGS